MTSGQIWVYNSIRNIGENEIQLRNHLQLENHHSTLAKLDIFPLYNFPKLWQLFPYEQIKFKLYVKLLNLQKAQTLFNQRFVRYYRLRSTFVPHLYGRPHVRIRLNLQRSHPLSNKRVLFRISSSPSPLINIVHVFWSTNKIFLFPRGALRTQNSVGNLTPESLLRTFNQLQTTKPPFTFTATTCVQYVDI